MKNLLRLMAGIALLMLLFPSCKRGETPEVVPLPSRPEVKPGAKPEVKPLKENDFDNTIARAHVPVVVDFYATWCGPCALLEPTLAKAAQEYSGRIEFYKIDVDESPGLAQRYNVQGIPLLLFFKDGKIVDHIMGYPPPEVLQQRLEAFSK